MTEARFAWIDDQVRQSVPAVLDRGVRGRPGRYRRHPRQEINWSDVWQWEDDLLADRLAGEERG